LKVEAEYDVHKAIRLIETEKRGWRTPFWKDVYLTW